MADTKISALASGAPAQPGDELVIARGGANFKLTNTNLLTLTTSTANTWSAAQTFSVAGSFTAAQTFRAANAIRSEAASTQDAVVIAGRAGGTSSYAVTLTPTTLTANRTVTIPDETMTVGFRNVPQSGSAKTTSYSLAVGDVGKFIEVGASGSITIPDATFAAGDVVSIFNNTSGNITITCTITTRCGDDTVPLWYGLRYQRQRELSHERHYEFAARREGRRRSIYRIQNLHRIR